MRAFVEGDVRFLVVGAYALAIHGLPRATGDLDLWIDPTAENAAKTFRALQTFGAPLHDLTEADLRAPDVVFQMGVEPRRIDILTRISGVSFAEAWPARVEGVFEGLRFPVLGRDQLAANKRAAARPKDLLDLESLERKK